MFDLPVDTDENRKCANAFRTSLLEFGFEMCQFSVYLRFCEGRDQAATWTKRVRSVLPPGGKVYCLYFTDKQYEGIVRFEQKHRLASKESPSQFQLI